MASCQMGKGIEMGIYKNHVKAERAAKRRSEALGRKVTSEAETRDTYEPPAIEKTEDTSVVSKVAAAFKKPAKKKPSKGKK